MSFPPCHFSDGEVNLVYSTGPEVWRSFLPVILTIWCKVYSIIVIRNNLQWICFTCYFFSSLRSCPWKIFFTFSFICSFIFFFPASTLTVPVIIICIPIIIKSTAINLLINNLPQKGMILIPTEIIMANISSSFFFYHYNL